MPILFSMRRIDPGLLVVCCAALLLGCHGDRSSFRRIANTPYDFAQYLETGDNLAFSGDSVYYTRNVNGIYQLFSNIISHPHPVSLPPQMGDIDHPFIHNGVLHYLKDAGGMAGTQLAPLVNGIPLGPWSQVFASGSGKYTLLKLRGKDSIYVLHRSNISPLSADSGVISGACFSEQDRAVILSIGAKLWCIHLTDGSRRELFPEITSPKINPFVFGHRVYFCSYDGSDHYRIFSGSLLKPAALVVELQDSTDCRLPQRNDSLLFFVQVHESRYLLKYKNLHTGVVSAITSGGVTYNYRIRDSVVVFVYSDSATPRGILAYNLKEKTMTAIDCRSFSSPAIISSEYLDRRTPPVTVIGNGNPTPPAIILYFHPGRSNDDFSPRWDNMLWPLAANGYRIYAPNFPGSTGYGRCYEKAGPDSAIAYMNRCLRVIRGHYPYTPIFLYGISSGCPLMEYCLRSTQVEIAGTISVFGLSSGLPTTKSVPGLFILGTNDPIVPFEPRNSWLKHMQSKNGPVTVVPLDNTKHWIQHPAAFNHCFSAILEFLKNNTNAPASSP